MKLMRLESLASITFLIAVFTFCSGEILAQGGTPTILNVDVEYTIKTPQTPQIFTIKGSSLGTTTSVVTLGGQPLTVQSNDGVTLVAIADKMFYPVGSYQLMVKVGNKSITFDTAVIDEPVDIVSDQTVGGSKTFSSTIKGSITGNAGSVTNGVYTTGSYANPAWITSLDGSKLTGNVSAGTVNATQYNIAGTPVFSIPGNNSFFGQQAGSGNTTGSNNSFFGQQAGYNNTTGVDNSFVGQRAGYHNTTGSINSFVGKEAGYSNTTGYNNSFFGTSAGTNNTTGYYNSFFGTSAGGNNTTGNQNSFVGQSTGFSNTTGVNNSFFGQFAGVSNTTGSSNSFFGRNAGGSNKIGSNNSLVGNSSDVGVDGLTYATAIGSGAIVSTSNTIVLGRPDGSDNVRVPGLGAAGSTQLCRNANNEISNCSPGTGGLAAVAHDNTLAGDGSSANPLAVSSIDGSKVSGKVASASLADSANALASTATISGSQVTGTVANATNATNASTVTNGVYTTGSYANPAWITSLDGSKITGNVSAGTVNATQYNIGGSPVLSIPSSNSFVGLGTGTSNTTGNFNSFFGQNAGSSNTTGVYNSFVGQAAGFSNTTGNENEFFGTSAGYSNMIGKENSFVGSIAGYSNTMGSDNSFFGIRAGYYNTTGSFNSFLGRNTGVSNNTGSNNTNVGANADVGVDGLTYATAIGSGAIVSTSNTIVLGRPDGSDNVRVPGLGASAASDTQLCRNANLEISKCVTSSLAAVVHDNTLVGDGSSANPLAVSSIDGSKVSGTVANATNAANAANASTVTNGVYTTGSYANPTWITSLDGSKITGSIDGSKISGNISVGTVNAAQYNIGGNRVFSIPGIGNSFVGQYAGSSNTTGNFNSFFGMQAGYTNTIGNYNSFFGQTAGTYNTTGSGNSFIGSFAGNSNTSGSNNSFFGQTAGYSNTTGNNNSYFGTYAGDKNTTGSDNSFIGNHSDVGVDGLTYATAIGSGAVVSTSNTVQLGRNGSDTVRVGLLGSAGATTLCLNTNNEISNCSSSLRYKTNIAPFNSGLNLVNRLKPITFNWKAGGMADLGLGAEDVAKIEPLLVNRNSKGEVEGVKYDRIGVVLLNAVKEQQVQIENQQKQLQQQQVMIDGLKKLLCQQNPQALVCK